MTPGCVAPNWVGLSLSKSHLPGVTQASGWELGSTLSCLADARLNPTKAGEDGSHLLAGSTSILGIPEILPAFSCLPPFHCPLLSELKEGKTDGLWRTEGLPAIVTPSEVRSENIQAGSSLQEEEVACTF